MSISSRQGETWLVVVYMGWISIGFLLGVICAEASVRASQRAEAVRAGVGYYAVDAKTGETKFVYGKPAFAVK